MMIVVLVPRRLDASMDDGGVSRPEGPRRLNASGVD